MAQHGLMLVKLLDHKDQQAHKDQQGQRAQRALKVMLGQQGQLALKA
jgi:hypothetical protein